MPDASRGVPVEWWADDDGVAKPGTWYPVALAEARERVVEAADALCSIEFGDIDAQASAYVVLDQAVRDYRALEGADTEGGS